MATAGNDGSIDVNAQLKAFRTHLAELADDTDAVRSSEAFRSFLDTCAAFWRYSPFNQYLIALQRRDARLVASASTWASLGRKVRVHQAPIVVLAPSRGRSRRRFVGVPVFDISQTKGRPLKGWRFGVDGRAPRLVQIEAAASVLDIVVEDVDASPGQGWEACALGGRVRIVRGLAPAERASALLHEFGHEVLRHPELGSWIPRRLCEAEAESVSFVVSRALGMPTRAADYLALYRVRGAEIVALRERIAAACQKVLTAIVEQRLVEPRGLAPTTCRRCGLRHLGRRAPCPRCHAEKRAEAQG